MIAIYVRVSSEKQKKKGHSINEQIEYAKYYIEKNLESKEYEVYNDSGFSAATMNRPALKKLLNDIACSIIDTVIFLHIDRISRDVLDAGYFIKHCNIYNVKTICLSHPIDVSTPEGRMNLQFSTVFAEFERAKISERTKFGLHGGLNKGFYSIGGLAPFGYKRKGNILIIDEITSPIVVSLFKRFATSAISLRSLCRHYKNAPRLTNGKKIPYNSIPKILKNTVYTGKVIVDHKQYTVAPRIISDNLFDAVQKKLSKHSHTYTSNIYLFSSKLFCKHCQQKLINVSTYKKYKRYLYYCCSNKKCKCYKRRINETIVYDQLKSVLYTIVKSKYNSDLISHNSEIKSEIKILQKKIEKEEELGKTALLKLVGQIISDEEFKLINTEVRRHIQFLHTEITELQQKIIKPNLSLHSMKKQNLYRFLQSECPNFEIDLVHRKCSNKNEIESTLNRQ